MLATQPLKTAIVRKLRADFNHTRIPGLTELPLIIQDRPLHNTPEPYIYVEIYPDAIEEVDVTKSSSSYDYFVNIQVMTKSLHNQDSKRQRDLMTSEAQRVLDVETNGYVNLTNEGFNVYVQTVESVTPLESYERGADYFYSTILMRFTINFVGLPQTVLPVQAASYTFAGFTFAPTGSDIETYDAGTITGAATYPSNNNGWDFTTASYALTSGSEGTLNNNVLTVASDDDPLGLVATINYEFNTDTSVTTSVTDTDTFSRIKSLRYGSRSSNTVSSADLQDFSLWTGTNQTFDFGNVNPINDTITLTGNAGEYLYIIHDAAHGITGLRDVLGTDNISNFTLTELDGYRILILNRALAFDNFSLTLTIT